MNLDSLYKNLEELLLTRRPFKPKAFHACDSLSVGILKEKKGKKVRKHDIVKVFQNNFANVALHFNYQWQSFLWQFEFQGKRYHAECSISDVYFSAVHESYQGIRLALVLHNPPFLYRDFGEKIRAISCDSSPQHIDRVLPQCQSGGMLIGSWLSYVFDFENSPRISKAIRQAVSKRLVKFSTRLCHLEASVYAEVHSALLQNIVDLDFRLRYLIECIISSELAAPFNLTDTFIRSIKRLPLSKSLALLEEFIIVNKRVHATERWLYDRLKNLRHVVEKFPLPSFCTYIYRIAVTPTKILVMVPVVETTNRVIRQYMRKADRFLRVEFVDDNMGTVGSSVKMSSALHQRILTVLLEGLYVGGRKYEFLVFSSSQLREHQCWFFSNDDEVTTDDIRAWMGDFSQIKSVARRAARMGQCFSTTRHVKTKIPIEIAETPDIYSRDGEHMFSDGVGKISLDLLFKAKDNLKLSFTPTALQMRIGGYKGVLALCPNLNDNSIVLRPSQKKFPTKYYQLEIVRPATFSHCYLNRQVIILLSCLGIKDQVFIDLKNTMLKKLNYMLDDDDAAISILCSSNDFTGFMRRAVKMIEVGLIRLKDPFLLNLLQLVRIDKLRDLKFKTRIHVKDGVLLIGVIDETGTLKENEVFVQYFHENIPEKEVVVGKCMVTRNPCFHPGDIRVVQAVDVSDKLGHLVNCIVFPAVGNRDIPSQCSGGDLDGDTFLIVWDQLLIPDATKGPMEPDSKETDTHDETLDGIKKFFVNYIISDNLGRIANAHLALSDQLTDGPFNEACLELAKLHSKAVDFPKTGVKVDFPDEFRPKLYPDFMNKRDKDSYASERVLGALYRSIVAEMNTLPETEYVFIEKLLVPDYKKYLEQARKDCAEYNHEVQLLMKQFDAQYETEVVTGLLISPSKIKRRKPYELRKKVVDAYYAIEEEFTNRFHAEFDKIDLQEIDEEKKKKASAWYYVAYKENTKLEYEDSDSEAEEVTRPVKVLSFPWLVTDFLTEILRNL